MTETIVGEIIKILLQQIYFLLIICSLITLLYEVFNVELLIAFMSVWLKSLKQCITYLKNIFGI